MHLKGCSVERLVFQLFLDAALQRSSSDNTVVYIWCLQGRVKVVVAWSLSIDCRNIFFLTCAWCKPKAFVISFFTKKTFAGGYFINSTPQHLLAVGKHGTRIIYGTAWGHAILLQRLYRFKYSANTWLYLVEASVIEFWVSCGSLLQNVPSATRWDE